MILAVDSPANPITLDQFVDMDDSHGLELIGGVPTPRKGGSREMSVLSDLVGGRILGLLFNFAERTGAGYALPSDTTYRCFDDADSGRRGDASFIRKDRLGDPNAAGGYLTFPADLIVEVVSPNDKVYKVEEKVRLYLASGFGQVWVVLPLSQTVQIYQRGRSTVVLDSNETLVGTGVLEGFACPVRDFFPPPVQSVPALS